MPDKQFHSPAEVARELGISSATVLRRVHDGRLPALKVSERIYRIPAAAFERYKAGTLEEPFVAPLGATKPRPRFGRDEALPSTAHDKRTPRAPGAAPTRRRPRTPSADLRGIR